MVRHRALRRDPRHDQLRQGHNIGLLTDGRGGHQRPNECDAQGQRPYVHARLDLRGASRLQRGRPEEHRHHRARGAASERPRPRRTLRRRAKQDGRGPSHRQGGQGDGLLLGRRGQARAGRRYAARGRRVREVLQGRRLEEATGGRSHLPLRRQGRPRHPVLPGARSRQGDHLEDSKYNRRCPHRTRTRTRLQELEGYSLTRAPSARKSASPDDKDYCSYSFWLETAGEDLAPRPSLNGPTEADVAILGAGFTGLWTAYYLLAREPSLRVVVLEAE